MVARSRGAQAGVAYHFARAHQRFGRMAQAAVQFAQGDAIVELAQQAFLVDPWPQALIVQAVDERFRPHVEQGGKRLRAQRHVAAVFQQHMFELGEQLRLARLELGQAQAGRDQAHAAGDVRAGDGGDHHVGAGGDDAAHGRNAARVEVGRGARLADMAILARYGDGGKFHQLAHGFFLERKVVGQQHGRLGVRIAECINAVGIGDGDTLAAQGFL